MLCSTRKAEADWWLLPGGLPLQEEPYKNNIRRKQEGMPNVVHQFALISVAHTPTLLLHTTA